jgi:hypothetical protein
MIRGKGPAFYILFVLLVLNSIAGQGQFYRGSNVSFGKNRVQHKPFDWSFFPGEHFEVYYYQGGQQIAERSLLYCEQEKMRLQKFYNVQLDDKIQVVCFNKQSEFRQSNLGLSDEETATIGGATNILGNKMFVYFEGTDFELREQIAMGLSRIMYLQLMYGGDWRSVVRGNNRIAIPTWFSEGVIRYAALKDQRASERAAEDWYTNARYPNIHRLTDVQAELVGQSFWSYIGNIYGENVVLGILNMTQLFHGTDGGFQYVIGRNTETVVADYQRFIQQGRDLKMVEEELSNLHVKRRKFQFLEEGVVGKFKNTYLHVTPSLDEKKWAYTSHFKGEYTVYIYDTETKETTKVSRGDFKSDRIPDESSPQLAWHPNGQVLSYVTEKNGKLFWNTYQLESKEKSTKELFQIEKILSMKYSPDGKRVVLSGTLNGKTNISLLPITANVPQKLTDDNFDDIDPVFSSDGSTIYFSSNRGENLKLNYHDSIRSDDANFHIYKLKLTDDYKSEDLIQLTNANYSDKHLAVGKENKIQFIRSKVLFDERCSVYRDSAISSIDTTIHYRYFNVTETLQKSSRKTYNFFIGSDQTQANWLVEELGVPFSMPVNLVNDRPIEIEGDESQPEKEKTAYTEMVWVAKKKDETRIDTENFAFPSDRKKQQESLKQTDVLTQLTKIDIPKAKNYMVNYTTSYLQSTVDNQFASSFYQNYTGPTSISPGFSGFFKVGISDLMEDYKLTAGVRIAANFNNSDFGLSFENLKNRWDKKASLQRQSQEIAQQFATIRVQTYNLTHEWKYPFTETSAIKLTAIGRSDKLVVLSSDPYTASFKNQNEWNLGGKVEYIFDNTYIKGLNYRTGTRLKAWGEHFRQPTKWREENSIYVVGFDFRHYQPIHRDLTFAFRLCGSSSFGDYKVVNYLGGVDNWLGQRVDNSVLVSNTQGYTFQAFAGPLRGFYVNARNGNNFLLSNSELRLPLFRYLSNKSIKSDFADNFQVVGFFDIGSAWTGKSPYDDANDFNTITVTQTPITVQLRSNKEPIIYGYGFGLRSKVLGYYMRADWAWGVDDSTVMPRVFYLSLNLDF